MPGEGSPSPLPAVILVMPVRNEEAFIERSLGAVLEQDYPADRLEIVVVDGMSEDATVERVKELAASRGADVRVIENPGRTAPTALNLALREANGEVFVRVDGHCIIEPDYVRRCVDALMSSGADCAGGMWITVGETPVAEAIACAQSSRFGVGGVAFRTGPTSAGPVDTVPFGAYRRSLFDRVGGFDEELVRNQDDDFNYRIGKLGGVVWLDPSIRITYYCRSSLRRLFRQYHEYGVYKVRVLQKVGFVSIRHFVPAALVLALFSSGLLSIALRRPVWFLGVLGIYAAGNLIASVTASKDVGRVPLVAVAFMALHFGYGTGFLVGLWRWRRRFGARGRTSQRSSS